MIEQTLAKAVFLLALTAGVAMAADINGKWTAQMSGPGGETRSIAFNFKQDGTTLSGTGEGPNGEAIEIKNGKVDGERVSFTLSMNRGDGEMKITHTGTIKDSEITLNTKMEGRPGRGGPRGQGGPGGPGGSPRAMTLKRAD